MRAAEWNRKADVVAAVLPGYAPIRFGFAKFTDWVVSGYYADSSAFSASALYVEAFVMPRFVPADSIYFDYGFRVNGRWEDVSNELVDAVAASEPRLAEIATLEGLVAAASRWRRNVRHTELRLCAAVLMRDERALEEMTSAAVCLAPEVDWEYDVRARCLEFAALVQRDGFAAGEAALAARRSAVDQRVL